ncbi:MAG: hypothetical protein PSX36_16545 [bacterium]|nr:hypothetical protein [bacterium]
MVYLRRLCVFIFLSFIIVKGNAQAFKPNQEKVLKPIKDTVIIDSLSLVPGSLKFSFYPRSDSMHQPEVNYRLHAIIFKNKRPDSLRISYQRFPFNFEREYYHKNQKDLYSDISRPNQPFTIKYNTPGTNSLFESDGLTKNGNISRGITFGNSQDVVVNSNLNLQVSGKLTPEIDILMAATDNNIPFQADGTTAQLQEFDKVFIQLNNASTKMVVGDYQLSRPQNSYFMNFYKRAQGIYFDNSYRDSSLKNPLSFRTQLSGAVSRGKFSRQIFFGTENNQGPYRLHGADNETFIIVLSGTERIYIDGKLLQRGQENDYIIDYNTGELSFTARQIITKDKRIVAEFQYAERNYARSLLFFGEEISSSRSKVYFNVFSEQDNKNRPLQQELSQQQKNVMIDVGDSLNQAVYSGATVADFNTNEVFYRKTDTLVGSNLYSEVYVYTTQADSVNYTMKYSYVGAGKGYYNQLNTAANGKVYIWAAPVNGSLQGIYAPVIPLVTPKQSQMYTAGFTQSLTADNVLNVEGVYTKNDVNRFSTADKGNDEGSGVKVISKNQKIFRLDSLKRETKLIYNLQYEFVQQRFKQVERFRSIEFDRDWNRPLTGVILNDQSIGSAELGLVKSNKGTVIYGLNFFSEGSSFDGMRHNLNSNYRNKSIFTSYNAAYLTTNDLLNSQNTRFYRHKIVLSKTINKVKVSYSDEFENNLFFKSSDQVMLPRAYQFWEWEGSLSNADSSKNKIKVFYKERRDKLNRSTELTDSTKASNIGLQASIYSIKNNPITLLVTYRKLDIIHTVGNTLKPDNSLLNRLEYNPRYLKGFITASMFYETGYGLENKRDFYYLEVAPGQGQYAWNDYNGNGIKERDEFETALYTDQQKYIRIYTPTNEYVKVLQNQLSISVNVRPSSIVKVSKGGIRKFVNRWMFQTATRRDNRLNDNNSLNNFNPFAIPTGTLLLASNNNARHSVFFNQSSAVFGADYTYIYNQSKQLLTSGIEEKKLLSNQIKWRINFLKAWAIYSDNMLSTKSNTSEFFPIRNYAINAFQTEQKISFQPNTLFRISGIYKHEEKKNTLKESPEQALINSIALEIRYNQTEKGSLSARADLIRINYNYDQNSSIAYEMLNGLSPGDNFTWEITYQRNLNSVIQMSVNYNGRKTPGAPVVQLGGAQIRAFF